MELTPNIQFPEGAAPAAAEPSDALAANDAANDAQKPAAKAEEKKPGDGGQEKQPEATFTQAQLDAMIASRLAQAEKQAKKNLLDFKALGFEDKAAVENALKSIREREEQDKSELQKAQEAKSKADEALTKYMHQAMNAEARAQAIALGVPVESLSYVTKLADFTGIEPNEAGDLDEAAIKAAIEQVLIDVPALKGVAKETEITKIAGITPADGAKAPETTDPFLMGFTKG